MPQISVQKWKFDSSKYIVSEGGTVIGRIQRSVLGGYQFRGNDHYLGSVFATLGQCISSVERRRSVPQRKPGFLQRLGLR